MQVQRVYYPNIDERRLREIVIGVRKEGYRRKSAIKALYSILQQSRSIEKNITTKAKGKEYSLYIEDTCFVGGYFRHLYNCMSKKVQHALKDTGIYVKIPSLDTILHSMIFHNNNISKKVSIDMLRMRFGEEIISACRNSYTPSIRGSCKLSVTYSVRYYGRRPYLVTIKGIPDEVRIRGEAVEVIEEKRIAIPFCNDDEVIREEIEEDLGRVILESIAQNHIYTIIYSYIKSKEMYMASRIVLRIALLNSLYNNNEKERVIVIPIYGRVPYNPQEGAIIERRLLYEILVNARIIRREGKRKEYERFCRVFNKEDEDIERPFCIRIYKACLEIPDKSVRLKSRKAEILPRT